MNPKYVKFSVSMPKELFDIVSDHIELTLASRSRLISQAVYEWLERYKKGWEK